MFLVITTTDSGDGPEKTAITLRTYARVCRSINLGIRRAWPAAGQHAAESTC